MNGPSVVVVGAGIVGVLTARTLVERVPEARVTIVERDGVATGASRRSAGLHFPRGASAEVRRMSAASERFYADVAARDPAAPIHPVGMTVVAGPDRVDEVRAAYLPGAGLTETDDVGDPQVRLPDGHTAWTVRGGQYADVAALTRYLAAGLAPPARQVEGVAVTAVEEAGTGVRVRLSTGDTVHADRVVLAPGPWVAAPAWRDLVAPLALRVKKVVALHVDRPVAPGDRCTVFHDEDAFLLPLAHRGHWLFSYTCDEWDVDPDDAAPALRRRHLDEARAVLARYCPGLARHCRSGRVFCDAYTPDRRPLIRTVGTTGRVVFAGAANGSGYRLAPAIADTAVGLLDLKGSS